MPPLRGDAALEAVNCIPTTNSWGTGGLLLIREVLGLGLAEPYPSDGKHHRHKRDVIHPEGSRHPIVESGLKN